MAHNRNRTGTVSAQRKADSSHFFDQSAAEPFFAPATAQTKQSGTFFGKTDTTPFFPPAPLQKKSNGVISLKDATKASTGTLPEGEIDKYFEDYKKRADQILARWYKNTKTKEDRAPLTGDMFANAARKIYEQKKDLKYVVPVEYALSQTRLEGGVSRAERGGKGNVFNVAAFDSGRTAAEGKINTLEKGFDSYYAFMAEEMLDNKSPDELLKKGNFTKGGYQSGGVYATNPLYEAEIKMEIGKMHMADGGFGLTGSVGSGGKNAPADVAVVGGMLAQLGYLGKDDVTDASKVSAAILAFQTKEIAPQHEEWFKKRMKEVTNPIDQKNMAIKIASATDGLISKGGGTLGMLYYMSKIGNTIADTGGNQITPTEPKANTGGNTAPKTTPATNKPVTNNNTALLEPIATQVYDAMNGLGTDETAVYTALAQLNHDAALINAFKAHYKAKYGSDVIDDIKGDFSDDIVSSELTTALSYLQATTPQTKPKGETSAASIKASVGLKGENNAEDVKIVQALLIAAGMLSPVNSKGKTNADGSCGQMTIDAITAFQEKKLHFKNPDGLVQVGGTTWKALSGQTATQDKGTAPKENTTPKGNNGSVGGGNTSLDKLREKYMGDVANIDADDLKTNGAYNSSLPKGVSAFGTEMHKAQETGSTNCNVVAAGMINSMLASAWKNANADRRKVITSLTGYAGGTYGWEGAATRKDIHILKENHDLNDEKVKKLVASENFTNEAKELDSYNEGMLKLQDTALSGIEYIMKRVIQHLPVLVAVDHTFSKSVAGGAHDSRLDSKGQLGEYNSGGADHWIVINGIASYEGKIAFSFFDPGRGTAEGANANNLLVLEDESSMAFRSLSREMYRGKGNKYTLMKVAKFAGAKED